MGLMRKSFMFGVSQRIWGSIGQGHMGKNGVMIGQIGAVGTQIGGRGDHVGAVDRDIAHEENVVDEMSVFG